MKILAVLIGLPIVLIFMFVGASSLGGYMHVKKQVICRDKGGQLVFVNGEQQCAKMELIK